MKFILVLFIALPATPSNQEDGEFCFHLLHCIAAQQLDLQVQGKLDASQSLKGSMKLMGRHLRAPFKEVGRMLAQIDALVHKQCLLALLLLQILRDFACLKRCVKFTKNQSCDILLDLELVCFSFSEANTF